MMQKHSMFKPEALIVVKETLISSKYAVKEVITLSSGWARLNFRIKMINKIPKTDQIVASLCATSHLRAL